MKEMIWKEDEKERFYLASGRLRELVVEDVLEGKALNYFKKEAAKLIKRLDLLELFICQKWNNLPLSELEKWNRELYLEETEQAYQKSYANPRFAVSEFGEEIGRILSHVSFLIGRSQKSILKGEGAGFLRLMEFFLELYSVFRGKEGEEEVKSALYYFKRDNIPYTLREEVRESFSAEESLLTKAILEEDLTKPHYLYHLGHYVSEDDVKLSAFLASLSEKEISEMARAHVEGFIEGFRTMRVSLEGKKAVRIGAHLGLERLVREELHQFAKKGLTGFASIINEGLNRQVDYDHRLDYGLYLDDAYVNYYLESYEKILSEFGEELKGFAGPAVIETFGEEDFSPENKSEAVSLSEKQRTLFIDFSGRKYQVLNRFLPAEKRSFSIIAYPLSSISKENFEEIFRAVTRINSMDNSAYKRIQQRLIDALDEGDYVRVIGRAGNQTDLIVKLHELENPEEETNFENCGADVNIPVGEVFTSPKLTGTKGILHVSKVYLKGLLYENLWLEFLDGKVVNYSISNFEKEEDNLKFVEENLLYHHKTLPLGEFAIGTNTLAYKVGIQYDISGKLPILIAEKTGPHFALGDTCYFMQEEHSTFNPDGKKVVAKENECSALRKTDISKAYFNCHTDITLPYSELGELTVHRKDGSSVILMRDGRFVLSGTEELNQYLLED